MKVKNLRKFKSELKKDFIKKINEKIYNPYYIKNRLFYISELLLYKSLVLKEIEDIERENKTNEEIYNYIVERLEEEYNYNKDEFVEQLGEEFDEELKNFIKKILEQYT